MSAAAQLAHRVREDFDVVRHGAWLVAGVVNPVPKPVAGRVHDELADWFAWGAPHVLEPAAEDRRRDGMLRVLAGSVGVEARDVALTRGVGEGYQDVLRGIDWRPGDRVVCSADEEAALLLPTLHLAQAERVEVDIVHPRTDGVYRVEDFAERITPRTRLVAFSEVTTEYGSRLPARGIARAAREAGCLSYVDLAHSAGLGATDLDAIGCDAAGMLSYKWHYGPYGLGLLYLSAPGRERVRLRYAGGRAQRRMTHPGGPFELQEGTRSFQYGPWLWPTVAGWSWAVEYLSGLGWQAIEDHTAALAGLLKRELLEIPAVSVETPLDARDSAALVAFSVAGWASEELRDALWDRAGVRVKARENSTGVRAGIALFTTAEEVDRLLDGVRSVAGDRTGRMPSAASDGRSR